MANLLTHDMVRRGGVWRCVDCKRTGATSAEVNAVPCPVTKKDNQNLLDAIAGTGEFAPEKKS